MSPRGAGRSASGVLPDLPSQSPKTSRSNTKRNIGTPEESSPARKSKRLKSGEVNDPPRLPSQSQANGNGTAPDSKHSRDTPSTLKTEIQEESDLPITVRRGKKGAVKQEPEERTTIVTGEASRKRKTKEEKEAEAMPLRARTQGLRMFVGAHVSAAKGIFNAVNNSMHIGGNAFALFLKSQRKWDNPPLQDDHRDQFRQRCLEQKYDAAKHILPHGSYLVNLAQEDKAKAKQAYNSFLDDLHRCEALGINLYNFHPGSAGQTNLPDAISRLAKALTNALSATSTVTPVLETMCGQGTTIGGSLTEFRDVLAQIPEAYHSRIGICVDTCHSFAAGYDLATPTGFQAFMQEFEEVVGLRYLRALHLNDSKTPRGSKRDLHANIGTGFLGLRGFHSIMNESRFQDLPMILETPIDRPATANNTNATTNPTHEDGCASEMDSDSDPETKPKSKTKTKKQPKATPKTPMVADPSIWAREIELLESLIGMDPEGPEFRSLEMRLAGEGEEMRQKHQEQFDRRVEAEKKKSKGAGTAKKGQKSVMDMMKKKGTTTAAAADDDGGGDGSS